jgi:pimeloyl-ACP methyl ester carboxylesterase
VVVLHGTPSSRLDACVLDEAARRLGWRVIAPDRPGIGRSSPQPGRRLVDWPADLTALLDHVVGAGPEAPRVPVLGYSGGAPYALVMAHARPERVSMAAVVSGWGPPDRPGAYRGVAWPEHLFDGITRQAPALTRAALAATGAVLRRRPALGSVVFDPRLQFGPFIESLRQGAAGPTDDLRLIVRPWGFPIGAVRVPVHLWHGSDDPEIPVHHAEFVARIVPEASLEIVPGADHLLLFSHADEILSRLSEVVDGLGGPVDLDPPVDLAVTPGR